MRSGSQALRCETSLIGCGCRVLLVINPTKVEEGRSRRGKCTVLLVVSVLLDDVLIVLFGLKRMSHHAKNLSWWTLGSDPPSRVSRVYGDN